MRRSLEFPPSRWGQAKPSLSNIGYARVSTDQPDLTAQHDGLQALGVAADRIHVVNGLTGIHLERPGCIKRLPPAAPASTPSASSRNCAALAPADDTAT